jgi:hypothetical protein
MAAGQRRRRRAEAASVKRSEERISDGSFHKNLAGLMRGTYKMKQRGCHIGSDSSMKQVRKINGCISPAILRHAHSYRAGSFWVELRRLEPFMGKSVS